MDDAGPIADVRRGMDVVDETGERVGTVELVRIGDPEAVTPRGQVADGGLAADLRAMFAGSEPQVPDELAARLMRIGFVKVDGSGILDRDLYVASDQLGSVVHDVVRLDARREDLVREQ